MFELFDQEKPKQNSFSWKSKLIEIIITSLLTSILIALGNKYILN